MAEIIYFLRGKNYEERKKNLTEKIRNGDLVPVENLEKDLTKYFCYFCTRKIENDMRKFEDNGFHFALDSKCYAKARGIYLLK